MKTKKILTVKFFFFNSQFVNKLLALLLYEITLLYMFNTLIFFKIFVISQSTEIIIEPNFWLSMYVPYIPKKNTNICEI